MLDVGVFSILFDKSFLATVAAAVVAFAAIVTLILPMIEGNPLDSRLKAVAERREELRQRHHESLNSKRGSLRSTPVGFMKQTVDQLKLSNILESENTREKLTQAGFRGQGPVITFMFFRFVMPPIMFVAAL